MVELVGDRQGPEFLARDVLHIGNWFAARELPPEVGQPTTLLEELRAEVGMSRLPATSQQ
ncbi:MAG: kinase 1 [Pseudonocardiales bacterium]|nr:kinase 1 [Pseudonocardiales bacterium]